MCEGDLTVYQPCYISGTAVSREGDGDESPSSDDMSYPRLPPEGAPASENHLQSVLT